MLYNFKYKTMGEQKEAVVHLKCVARIASIPLIETSWTYASDFYTKVKVSNPLFNWGLSTAEATVQAAVERTKPIVSKFEVPLSLADSLVCKSLDLVEKQLPVITLPPELIFVSTKDYVSSTIVQPVLKRADSVKQFGREQAHTVLESKYTNFAAYRLDSALDLADKYIDQYLPPAEGTQEESIETNNTTGSKAVQALHKADRVTKKLQRRLTQRTLAEARALKKQSEDTLQTLMYLGELLVKDPKAVFELSKDLWAHLSQDEPENQAPPTTLEQLMVMLTRESARRIVHLFNYTRSAVVALPHNVNVSLHKAAGFCSDLSDALVKAAHLEEARNKVISNARQRILFIQKLISDINSYATNQLGIVHHYCTTSAQTLYKMCYCQILQRLRRADCHKMVAMHENSDQQLSHGNASAHATQHGQKFPPKNHFPEFQQPLFLPDPASSDLFLSLRNNNHWERERYQEIHQNLLRELSPISEDDF
ncbi:lipid storage droplets surface-binding protein 1 isoform X1 [Schistocerca serialis cubense]|uniref:lipid storage droplets surface-binding protein 1 isoform X1 n=1 Tax=Schistocerca serialis cubense TaxID=2023355 RepID=UPI00214E42E1|nr:lipid storage droplets surface-binding protein 1 isoform X1 [Schistocerca serialis cubense]